MNGPLCTSHPKRGPFSAGRVWFSGPTRRARGRSLVACNCPDRAGFAKGPKLGRRSMGRSERRDHMQKESPFKTVMMAMTLFINISLDPKRWFPWPFLNRWRDPQSPGARGQDRGTSIRKVGLKQNFELKRCLFALTCDFPLYLVGEEISQKSSSKTESLRRTKIVTSLFAGRNGTVPARIFAAFSKSDHIYAQKLPYPVPYECGHTRFTSAPFGTFFMNKLWVLCRKKSNKMRSVHKRFSAGWKEIFWKWTINCRDKLFLK